MNQPIDMQTLACACESASADHRLFTTAFSGCDETDGRFANVSASRCRSCGRHWLRYFIEYEAFRQSGRWARGLITDQQLKTITPETAIAHLNSLEWYLYGGSYFLSGGGRRKGPMHWGL